MTVALEVRRGPTGAQARGNNNPTKEREHPRDSARGVQLDVSCEGPHAPEYD